MCIIYLHEHDIFHAGLHDTIDVEMVEWWNYFKDKTGDDETVEGWSTEAQKCLSFHISCISFSLHIS